MRNCALIWKTSSQLALINVPIWVWNYSPNYSLNCSPLGPITIINYYLFIQQIISLCKQMSYLNARVSHFLGLIIVWFNTSFLINFCSADFKKIKHRIKSKIFIKQPPMLQSNVLTHIALLTFTVHRLLWCCLLRKTKKGAYWYGGTQKRIPIREGDLYCHSRCCNATTN